METAAWIVSGLLAAMYVVAGLTKLTQPITKLRPQMGWVDDIPFGLGSYVYTTDPQQADRVADKIEAGMVFVNVVLADGAELPFGGVKRSGSGRELGRFGADEFVNKKLIRIG